ncbi:major facilitator superfamily domain-containing protein 6 [Stomoxys calcitrans]|uniref:major facilitator superfamily domain-containing protein 6 n=1 Tax=Stomoxys calcitrans TaxID=35570 RepID=UPI0027E376BF|nr:major facilitator superfamily domain-containing protein 6 [Stomoxys calcitrans]XP_013119446.2 major facilitator superfamily domain-containing protein 6 [Stomoxys calcitrans]XP_013119448.2 major facilitator superfamily domain-containing protein 6 [Stomoxys calcitrans]
MAQYGGGAPNPFGAPSGMGGYEQQQSQFGDYGGGGGGYDQSGGYGQDAGYGQGMGATGVPQQPYGVAARPRVDVEAEGEVDPTLYPEPKEATNKIRGHADVVEMLFGPTEHELIPVKSFYFFFYAAFGSLFPLMGVYFKQMGMNPGQCGILIGMRPFVEFLSAPFWGSYADRCRQGKKLLLGSLACWILFTIPLSFIKPEPVKCIEHNATGYVLTYTRSKRDLSAFNIADNLGNSVESFDSEAAIKGTQTKPPTEALEESHSRRKRSIFPRIDAGISPVHIRFVSNYDAKEHNDYVTPIFSSMVYRTPDIQKAFFLLLLVILIGEFFSAPAITLADSAVITLLGEDSDKYGHQRMFGSLGWGISMFVVGIVLDHSTSFSHHPCGAGHMEKNYNVCFAIFTVLMTCAIISATKITFKYEPLDLEVQQQQNVIDPNKKAEDESMNQLAAQLNLPSLAVAGSSGAETGAASGMGGPTPNIGAESKMFAQTNKEMPEWMTVLTHIKDLKTASFLFVAWFMGFGIGLIFTFLFWHLQDFGGTPTLFGVASVINHVSEIFAYFFSFRLITKIGHVKVLCLGLMGNVVRFLYISYISNPWMVLPFELMQGITHAAVWAASCSYIAHNTPKHLRSSSQGVLQGIHHGLGRGCGAIIGGMFVTYYGTTVTFRWYGICCLFVLGLFIFVNFYRKEQGFISEIPVTEDPHQVAEETSHLAPHGVPSNPIPRALSNTRLNEMNPNGTAYGTYQTSGGNLDIPGGNPFGTQ